MNVVVLVQHVFSFPVGKGAKTSSVGPQSSCVCNFTGNHQSSSPKRSALHVLISHLWGTQKDTSVQCQPPGGVRRDTSPGSTELSPATNDIRHISGSSRSPTHLLSWGSPSDSWPCSVPPWFASCWVVGSTHILDASHQSDTHAVWASDACFINCVIARGDSFEFDEVHESGSFFFFLFLAEFVRCCSLDKVSPHCSITDFLPFLWKDDSFGFHM